MTRKLSSFYSDDHSGTKNEQVNCAFDNFTPWMGRALGALPVSWASRLTLPGAVFEATVSYQNGVVGELHIVEMQQDIPGHASPQFGLNHHFLVWSWSNGALRADTGFSGYSTYSRSTGQVSADGKLTSFSCCHQRWVMLDERATPTQLSDSLNFHVQCLTSWRRCKDDREILR